LFIKNKTKSKLPIVYTKDGEQIDRYKQKHIRHSNKKNKVRRWYDE